MKIAIASSGLGHVARGIETWARDSAAALADYAVDRDDISVTLFMAPAEGGRSIQHAGLTVREVPCSKRGRFAARVLARLTPPPLWRLGLKSTYGWEQFTFWLNLRRRLKRGEYDILHVQDPMLADWCRRWRERGWIRTREILAHGTEEPPEFLARLKYIQHLAPWHREQVVRRRGRKKAGEFATEDNKGNKGERLSNL